MNDGSVPRSCGHCQHPFSEHVSTSVQQLPENMKLYAGRCMVLWCECPGYEVPDVVRRILAENVQMKRAIRTAIAQLGVPGRYDHLLESVRLMDRESLNELHRLIQNVQSKLNDAERTYRPFPGGPRLRM